MVNQDELLKFRVKDHWEDETCGTRYSKEADRAEYFAEITAARYQLEPYIPPFADFASARGKRMLEIGIGAGADFQNWCRFADHATGVDLTQAAIQLTGERLALEGIDPQRYDLRTADAEELPFANNSFDLVYSWGVLHHTPNTQRGFQEVLRVLRPGGEVRAMIYHHPSWTALMLYVRYALLHRQFRQTLKEVVFEHLESPGTKTYTRAEASALLREVGFTRIELSVKLGPGDVLSIRPSKKYSALIYNIIWRLYPRWLVRLLGDRYGLNLMIKAVKPGA